MRANPYQCRLSFWSEYKCFTSPVFCESHPDHMQSLMSRMRGLFPFITLVICERPSSAKDRPYIPETNSILCLGARGSSPHSDSFLMAFSANGYLLTTKRLKISCWYFFLEGVVGMARGPPLTDCPARVNLP